MASPPIELLYTTHNRKAFTEASLQALLQNTNWELVRRLHIADDRSRDGTYELLCAAARDIPVPVRLRQKHYGGSVNGLIEAAQSVTPTTEILAKIDNDVIVSPGWLEAMLEALASDPAVDALGMEPGFAERYDP